MYQKWLKAGEARFVSMTGYSINVFNDLLPYFEEAHNHYFSRYKVNGKKKKRFRAFVIYKNSPLPTVADRLSFMLSFQKLNPIQEQQADWFTILITKCLAKKSVLICGICEPKFSSTILDKYMTQKQCNEFIHSLTIVLDNSLMTANVKPATTEKELLQKLDAEKELTLIHDGTEREIPRPVDDEAQKENYSGKKKKHTLKNGIIATTLCVILFVSNTISGAVHDKKIAEQHYANTLNRLSL